MNDEKPDELSERSEFSSGRHSSVRRREPASGGPDGRGLRRLIQNLGEQILVAVGGRDPRVFLVRLQLRSWRVAARRPPYFLPAAKK